MEVLRTSVRAVVRGIRRSPGFTLGVIIILTLGLGVNAVTFGLVDRLILSGPAAYRSRMPFAGWSSTGTTAAPEPQRQRSVVGTEVSITTS